MSAPNTPSTGASLSADDEALLEQFINDNQLFYGPDPDIVRNHTLMPRTSHEDEVLKSEPDINRINLVRGRIESALEEGFTMVEKMGTFHDHLMVKKVAEMQSNVSKAELILKMFENRLTEAMSQAKEVDPKLTELVKERSKRVELLETRVKESKDRLEGLKKQLQDLMSQKVTAEKKK